VQPDPAAYEQALADEVLRYLRRAVQELDGAATLHYVGPTSGHEGVELVADLPDDYTTGHWALTPRHLAAAELRWHVNDSDADSTYLQAGRTCIELCTTPGAPVSEPLGWLDEIVTAVVAGRFLEREWHSKQTRSLIGLQGRICYQPGQRWRALSEVQWHDDPKQRLPLFGYRRLEKRVRHYQPYQ
jgi:hypothetical protein